MFTDGTGFTVNWDDSPRLDEAIKVNWIVTFTKPNGEKVVVDQHTTNPDGET